MMVMMMMRLMYKTLMDSHHLRYPLPATVKVQDDNSGKVNHKLEIFSEQGFRARPPIRRSLLERPNSKKTGKKFQDVNLRLRSSSWHLLSCSRRRRRKRRTEVKKDYWGAQIHPCWCQPSFLGDVLLAKEGGREGRWLKRKRPLLTHESWGFWHHDQLYLQPAVLAWGKLG